MNILCIFASKPIKSIIMKKVKLLSMITVMTVMFNSCAKDGATGPQGPAGQNGNANVSVGSYAIASSSWGSDGNGGWYTNLTPAFNPTQGAISILFSADDVNWYGLPYVGHTIGDADVNYIVNSTTIEILYQPQTGYTSISEPSVNAYIQVSLIPPSIMVQHPNTNWENAHEVAQLPEVQSALHK
jgi:hypothetical protein